MEQASERRFDSNFAAQILLEISHEQSPEKLLQTLVERAMQRPHIACAQGWLIEKGDLCATCPRRPECPDQTRCLHLIASKGESILEPGKGFGRFDLQRTREPLGVPPIGSVVVSGQERVVPDLDKRPPSPLDPDWMREEGIHGYNITPICFKGEVLGAIISATRETLQEQLRPWGRIFADYVGAGIANARAFEEIRAAGRRLEQANQRLERELAERKEAEERLRQSEQRYRRIVDTAAEGIWELDDHYATTYVNRRMAEMLGYEPQEMVGRDVSEFLFEDDLASLPARIAARRQGLTERFEQKYRHKDGRTVWMHVSAKSVRDAERRFVGSFAMLTDITERKRAEEEVALLSFALDNVSDAAFLIDDQARCYYANEEACRVLGYTRAELLGLGVSDIDPDFPLEHWSDHWRDLKAQRSLSFESRHRTRDGRVFPVEVSANYFEYGGRAYNLALVRDITERKRGEEALRRSEAYLAEGQRLSHTGSWAWSPITLQSLYWSEEMFRIFALDPHQGMPTNEVFRERIHPEDRDQAYETLLNVAHRASDYEHEHRIVLPDGTVKHIHAIGHPVLDPAGKLVEYVGTAIDVTERKLAEDELRKHREHLEELVKQRTEELAEAKARAEAANREKSRFLANMSHELRTPLNAVLGFSRLLKNGSDLTPHQQETLDIIVRSGEHLLNLINNVLDMAKIESGRMALEESEVDLHRLLHEIQSLMGVGAAEKGLHFGLEPAPDLPRFIAVDAGKLRQVLLNLIGNAIKYTDAGGVKLRGRPVLSAECGMRSAEWGRQSAEGGERAAIRFEVEDSGPGIRREDAERIFLPFVQLGDQAPAQAGTGLGLAICKQYVELMGGQIGVAGEPGKGSVFHFTIPVTVVPSVAEPAEETRHGRILGLVEGQPRYRLLIAEDQQDNRLLLRSLLNPLGFELREASNGREAVTLFEQWHPDLIWMDIRMPVMDGLQAVRRIRATKAGAGTKIIALTAHALEEERGPIMAAGCDDLVRKPFREQELFDALARHLGLRFIYDRAPGQQGMEDERGLSLRREQWDALPPQLLQDLRQAALELDTTRTQALIGQVTELDGSLGRALNRLASQLDYKRLLKLLERGHAQAGQTL